MTAGVGEADGRSRSPKVMFVDVDCWEPVNAGSRCLRIAEIKRKRGLRDEVDWRKVRTKKCQIVGFSEK
jgi:predicted glycosyltransferase involved in capsule biosynthesis